jgi:phosphoglucosamine mutase
MISASHNPFEDNGIKLFGPDGYKLSDDTEAEIEALMASDLSSRLATSAHLGRARRLDDAPGRYIEAAKASFPRGRTLDGVRVVVDCAHGAAYRVAPTVLRELGAEVIAVGVAPDGTNINRDCGSTHPRHLSGEVLAQGADLGMALDGDADRVIMCDERGQMIDGDQVLALIAENWRNSGRLQGGGIVATVMSNLGLERFLEARDIELHRARVGDRYVMEMMRERGMNVGGEQSGHMILTDFATTGDGLIAALQVLATVVQEKGQPSEVCRRFTPLPQKLKNVRFEGRSPLLDAGVQQAVRDAERLLKGRGRLLLRPSGTEPVIRVMAEAEDLALVDQVVNTLCARIESVRLAQAAE